MGWCLFKPYNYIETSGISMDYFHISMRCETSKIIFIVGNTIGFLLLQFPRRFGPIRGQRISTDRTRYFEDSSKNNWYSGSTFFIQES